MKMSDWKRGLPPGPYYVGMTDNFEVYFSPAGEKWHRRRGPDPIERHLTERNRRATLRRAGIA